MLELWALIIVTLLLFKLRRVERTTRIKSLIIERYSDRILEGSQPPHTLKKSRHCYSYSSNGDAVVEQWMEMLNGPEPLSLTRQSLSADREVDSKVRQKVRVEAQRVNTDGTLGAHVEEVTTKWVGDNELQCTVHFLKKIEPNAEFALYLKWSWHRLSEGLLKGGIEEFYWVLDGTTTSGISVDITFDKSCKIKHDLNVSMFPGCSPVTQQPLGDGHKLEWTYVPRVSNARVGFTLDSSRAV